MVPPDSVATGLSALAGLIADHAANGGTTDCTEYAAARYRRTEDTTDACTDHRTLLPGVHRIPTRTTGSRRTKGGHKNDH